MGLPDARRDEAVEIAWENCAGSFERDRMLDASAFCGQAASERQGDAGRGLTWFQDGENFEAFEHMERG